MSIDNPSFAPPRALESPKSDFSKVLYGRPGEGGNGLDGELIVGSQPYTEFVKAISKLDSK